MRRKTTKNATENSLPITQEYGESLEAQALTTTRLTKTLTATKAEPERLGLREKIELSPRWTQTVRRDRRNQQAIHARWGRRFLECPICISEFIDGYQSGCSHRFQDDGESEVLVGTRLKGNIPTSWSRGFVKGFKDSGDGNYKFGLWEISIPYNEMVRSLRERYPDEYPEEDTEETVSTTIALLTTIGMTILSSTDGATAEKVHPLGPVPGTQEGTAYFARWNDVDEAGEKLLNNGEKLAGIIKVVETDGPKPVITTLGADTDLILDQALAALAPDFTFRSKLKVAIADSGLPDVTDSEVLKQTSGLSGVPKDTSWTYFVDLIRNQIRHQRNMEADKLSVSGGFKQ